MRILFILLMAAQACFGVASVVQSVSCTEATGPNTTCVMPGSVTAGNFLVVFTGHPGGDECSTLLATYSDTQGSVFTGNRSDGQNPSGGQSNSCIITAPITSSGADTIVRARTSSNYPVAMWVVEMTGMATIAFPSASGGTADSGTTVNSGNVTSAAANLLLVCAASDNNGNVFNSASPSGSTTAFVAYHGGFLYKFVSPGTYSCTFNKSAGGTRFSAAALLISYTSASMVPRHRVVIQ